MARNGVIFLQNYARGLHTENNLLVSCPGSAAFSACLTLRRISMNFDNTATSVTTLIRHNEGRGGMASATLHPFPSHLLRRNLPSDIKVQTFRNFESENSETNGQFL